VHDHYFEARDGLTIMSDAVAFRSPFAPVGDLFDWLYLSGYLRRLLARRAQAIKREAEAAGPELCSRPTEAS
jgi:ligand-binding SRPBCC domain-containing protein